MLTRWKAGAVGVVAILGVTLAGGAVSKSSADDHRADAASVVAPSATETLASSFAAFRRARSEADALPTDPRGTNPYLQNLAIDESRLAFDADGMRIWLIPEGADILCVLARIVHETAAALMVGAAGLFA